MGNNRPVKTKHFIKFLQAHNCSYIRTEASHDHYKCPDCWRTITIRAKDKEIPSFHIQTNLKTMGRTMDYVYMWIQDNC